jgi:hypothetical protein
MKNQIKLYVQRQLSNTLIAGSGTRFEVDHFPIQTNAKCWVEVPVKDSELKIYLLHDEITLVIKILQYVVFLLVQMFLPLISY